MALFNHTGAAYSAADKGEAIADFLGSELKISTWCHTACGEYIISGFHSSSEFRQVFSECKRPVQYNNQIFREFIVSKLLTLEHHIKFFSCHPVFQMKTEYSTRLTQLL